MERRPTPSAKRMAGGGVKIAAGSLGADDFRLELPRRDGRVDRLVIARAVGLHGGYQQDAGHIQLDDISADELHLAEAEWHWPGGRVRAPAPLALQAPQVAVDIALGELRGRPRLMGRASLARASAPKVELAVRDTRLRGDLTAINLGAEQRADGGRVSVAEVGLANPEISTAAARMVAHGVAGTAIAIAWRPGGQLQANAGRVEVRGLSLRAGSLQVKVGVLSLSGLRAGLAAGRLRIEANEVTLEAVDLVLGAVAARIDRLRMQRGLVWSEGVLRVAEIEVERATLRAVIPAPDGAARPKAAGPKVSNLGFLDCLEGKVEVDLTVDAKVPFIVRRVATHEFRVPVRAGKIDYRRLERDLSMLEDALLDFAVRDGRLVLETNVPLSPFRGQPLVYWPLDGDDLTFARNEHLVRLRTLRNYQLPEKAKRSRRSSQSPAFELNRLDFDNLIVDLRLTGPAEINLGEWGTVRLGAPDRPGIDRITVTGDVRYAPGRAPKPTSLRAEVQNVVASLDGLRLGAVRLSAGAITLAALESVAVQFVGVRPVEAGAALHHLVVRDLQAVVGAA